MWTTKDTKSFKKVVDTITQKNIHVKRLEQAFINKPKLFSKFKLFASARLSTDASGIFVKAAIEGKICGLCKERFLYLNKFEWSSCCRDCAKTDKGKAATKAKREATILKLLGVTNASKSSVIKQKKIETCRKNNGVDYPLQAKRFRDKAKRTWKKNLGVDNPQKACSVKAKSRNTNKKNLGVDYPQQSIVCREKSNISRRKLYVVKTKRKEYKLEGYERFLIYTLESKYKEIIGQYEKTFKPIELEDKSIYYADFMLPSKRYFEVKSSRYLYGTKEIWQDSVYKAEQCFDQGINIKTVLVKTTKDTFPIKYIILPKDWFMWSRKKLIEYCQTKEYKVGVTPKVFNCLKADHEKV